MWNDIRKIENLDEYISRFDLLKFVDTIQVVPKGWYQSRVGKDDMWGTKLSFHENFIPDSYFLIKQFLLHRSFENNLSVDSGWTTEFYDSYNNTVGGNNEEWAIAKKVQGEICYKVLHNYSARDHKKILKDVNALEDFELKDLQKLYFRKIERICIRKYSHAICSNISVSDLNPRALFGLIKKDIIKPSKIAIMVDDNVIEDVLGVDGKVLFQRNERFEYFSRDDLKAKLEKAEFQEEVLDRLTKFKQ